MSASIGPWPALDRGGRPAPERLDVGRAIQGKVHGAASDFRWIASSPGLDPQGRQLERELLLGSEDAPERATSWRALERSYCAVVSYPSRAVDAALRSGFLEKQLLEWTPGEEAPAALGALLLLPRVAPSDDSDWWSESGNPGWSQPGFSLALEAPPSVSVDEEELAAHIERGCAALQEAVGEDSLACLYSSLFSGHRPAFLPGLERPLPPEALAALLLPLPREMADRLSIAGWVVSQRIDPDAFPQLWNVLVCHRVPAVFRSLPETGITKDGREAARALLTGDPRRLGPSPGTAAADVLSTGPRTAGSPEVIERLLAFATEDARRWLEPEELVSGPNASLQLLEAHAEDLAGCVQAVQDEVSRLGGCSGTLSWKRKHLEVKADLLRAAALALAPRTGERLGPPVSDRVPALLFCPKLRKQDWDLFGNHLGKSGLEEAIRQSRSCEPKLFSQAIDDWLAQWSRYSRHSWLRQIV